MRRIEHHQQTTINWLLSADHSPLETTQEQDHLGTVRVWLREDLDLQGS